MGWTAPRQLGDMYKNPLPPKSLVARTLAPRSLNPCRQYPSALTPLSQKPLFLNRLARFFSPNTSTIRKMLPENLHSPEQLHCLLQAWTSITHVLVSNGCSSHLLKALSDIWTSGQVAPRLRAIQTQHPNPKAISFLSTPLSTKY
jgi:hypothetical protein